MGRLLQEAMLPLPHDPGQGGPAPAAPLLRPDAGVAGGAGSEQQFRRGQGIAPRTVLRHPAEAEVEERRPVARPSGGDCAVPIPDQLPQGFDIGSGRGGPGVHPGDPGSFGQHAGGALAAADVVVAAIRQAGELGEQIGQILESSRNPGLLLEGPLQLPPAGMPVLPGDDQLGVAIGAEILRGRVVLADEGKRFRLVAGRPIEKGFRLPAETGQAGTAG